jgi:hypothetical protein
MYILFPFTFFCRSLFLFEFRNLFVRRKPELVAEMMGCLVLRTAAR